MNIQRLVFVLLCLWPSFAAAALTVFTCEPEWQALVKELGGDKVKAVSATTALQDPHHIEARPSLIAQLRRANLLVCTGADLEIGWLPALLRQAANPRVQPGQVGYFEAAAHVTMRDVPERVDRASGDVHPAGNPHIHVDARNILLVARPLAERLAEIDAPNGDFYRKNYANFAERWQVAVRRWEAQAKSLQGVPVVFQHKSWVYLSEWLQLKEVATLEIKPGVPPSVNYLVDVLEIVQKNPARMVVRAAYEDARPSQWFAKRARITEVVLPYTVGGDAAAKDLFSLFDITMQRLMAAAS